jgi:hypothetical protein
MSTLNVDVTHDGQTLKKTSGGSYEVNYELIPMLCVNIEDTHGTELYESDIIKWIEDSAADEDGYITKSEAIFGEIRHGEYSHDDGLHYGWHISNLKINQKWPLEYMLNKESFVVVSNIFEYDKEPKWL